jgi:hypothetical protein
MIHFPTIIQRPLARLAGAALVMLASFQLSAQVQVPGDDPLKDRWSNQPVRFDDELFLGGIVPGVGTAFGVVYPQPLENNPAMPATLYRRYADFTPIAGDSGRLFGINYQQVALVGESENGLSVEVFSGLRPGQVHIGTHPLPAACQSDTQINCRVQGLLDIAVDNFDGFDLAELSDGTACDSTNLVADEVAVAYGWRRLDAQGQIETAVRVEFLSWTGLEREDDLRLPPDPPVSVTTAETRGAVAGARIALQPLLLSLDLAGNFLDDVPFRQLFLVYPSVEDREPGSPIADLVMEGWRLFRNDAESCDTGDHTLTATAVNFLSNSGNPEDPNVSNPDFIWPVGGRVSLQVFDGESASISWDATVGPGNDFAGRDEDNNVVETEFLVLVWQSTSSGGQPSGEMVLGNWTANLVGGRPAPVFSNSNGFAIADRNGEAVDLLPASRVRLELGRIVMDGDFSSAPNSPDGPCFQQGVFALVDTELGPVVQGLGAGNSQGQGGLGPPNAGSSGTGNNEPVWPGAAEWAGRQPTTTRANINMTAGGFTRSRPRMNLGAFPQSLFCDAARNDTRWTGDQDAFYVAMPEGAPGAGDNAPRLDAVSVVQINPGNGTTPSMSLVEGHGLVRQLPYYANPDHLASVGPDFITVNMDIDGSGQADPDRDGEMILRFLMGLRGDALTDAGGLIDAASCTRCTTAEVQAYLEANALEFDVDDDGFANGLTDGLLRQRFLADVTGPALVENVLSPFCRRCEPEALIDYLSGLDVFPVPEVPVMLALDSDGDQPYLSLSVAPGQGLSSDRNVFLSPGAFHRISNIETFDVILAEPPKHVDWLPALGGIVNISGTPGLYAEFETETSDSETVEQETQTDWTVSESENVTRTVSAGVDLFGVANADVEGSVSDTLSQEHSSSTANFASQTNTVTITQVSRAELDDQLVSRINNLVIWRYPAAGANLVTEQASDGTRFFEVFQPTPSLNFFSAGRVNDAYQAWHENNNLLTYPVFTGQTYTPSFDQRGSYAAGNPNAPETNAPLWSENAFTVGGLTFFQSIEWTEAGAQETSLFNSNSVTESRDTSVSASVDVGATFKGIGVSGGFSEERSWSASSEFSYAQGNTSRNETTDRTRISLNIPGDIPGERAYRFHPAWFFTPDGGIKLAHAVALEGMGVVPETFWLNHYAAPDPALNMPFRIVRDGSGGYKLNTDPSRNAVKGMFFRDGRGLDPGNPGARRGTDLTFAPRVGDPVQVEVRVYNNSIGTTVENLKVRFDAQRFELGQEIGPRIPLGTTRIAELPHRGEALPDPEVPLSDLAHIKSAFLFWDTTEFGPESDNTLATWKIFVTLDPDNEIPDEVHNLIDRFDDPLLGVDGQPIDPLPGTVGVWLEKAQNNLGWGLVRIAPPLPEEAIKSGSDRGGKANLERFAAIDAVDAAGQTQARNSSLAVGEPVRLRLTVAASRLDRGTTRVLVYDRHPDDGGQVIAYRRIVGIDPGGIDDLIRWIPERAGDYTLHLAWPDADDPARSMTAEPIATFQVEPVKAER